METQMKTKQHEVEVGIEEQRFNAFKNSTKMDTLKDTPLFESIYAHLKDIISQDYSEVSMDEDYKIELIHNFFVKHSEALKQATSENMPQVIKDIEDDVYELENELDCIDGECINERCQCRTEL